MTGEKAESLPAWALRAAERKCAETGNASRQWIEQVALEYVRVFGPERGEMEAEVGALKRQLNDAIRRSERDHMADAERIAGLTRERDAAVYEATGLRNAVFAMKEIARRALGEE